MMYDIMEALYIIYNDIYIYLYYNVMLHSFIVCIACGPIWQEPWKIGV